MIYQISPLTSKKNAPTRINKGLIQARHIQARLKKSNRRILGFLSSPATAGPFLVPTQLWFD